MIVKIAWKPPAQFLEQTVAAVIGSTLIGDTIGSVLQNQMHYPGLSLATTYPFPLQLSVALGLGLMFGKWTWTSSFVWVIPLIWFVAGMCFWPSTSVLISVPIPDRLHHLLSLHMQPTSPQQLLLSMPLFESTVYTIGALGSRYIPWNSIGRAIKGG